MNHFNLVEYLDKSGTLLQTDNFACGCKSGSVDGGCLLLVMVIWLHHCTCRHDIIQLQFNAIQVRCPCISQFISGNAHIMHVFTVYLAFSSITEEEPGPLRGDFEKSSTKVSRTFSYLKNKMYKKARVSQHFCSLIFFTK